MHTSAIAHKCTYELERAVANRYLTGFYVCAICGGHKHVKSWTVSERVCHCLLQDLHHWEEQLRIMIDTQEQRLKRLRRQNTKARTVEFWQTIDCLQTTLESYKRSLRHIEVNRHFLAALERKQLH